MWRTKCLMNAVWISFSAAASLLQPWCRWNVWWDTPQTSAHASRKVWRHPLSTGGTSSERPTQTPGLHRWLCELENSFPDSSLADMALWFDPSFFLLTCKCGVFIWRCVNNIFDYFLFANVQLEIKNHIFFTPINWDDLYHKRITPPYNPNVVSVRVSKPNNVLTQLILFIILYNILGS